jgi:hypothetical protein
MDSNQMNSMVFGSPIPPFLPLMKQSRTGGIIQKFLDKRKPIAFYEGGRVPTVLGRPPKEVWMKVPTKGVDQVPALLQGGEVVIPKKDVPIVSRFLRREHIRLPNM